MNLCSKKFGGYLPLELNKNSEYYYGNEKQSVLAFNSCKAAIYYSLILAKVKRVYIPHYICSSMLALIEKLGVTIERYYLDDNLMPVGIEDYNDEDMILIVNYFGITHSRIRESIDAYRNVIVDNSQAFFAEPIIRTGVYNVYSCKKFIGTPDGGYLITKKLENEDISLDMDYSSENMDFCIQSLEYGTAYSYDAKKKNDIRILNNPLQMSYMTRRILMNADYEDIAKRRVSNFGVLDRELAEYNRWKLSGIDFVPYYYPLYLHKSIQRDLVSKGVFAPVLWSELQSSKYNGTLEQDMTMNIAFLPLDQRYDTDDMKEICERVKKCL